MNFVGSPQQPQTLRTGEIINTDRFGPSAAPDWDGSDLLDTNPRQVATPIHATWDDPESSFPPGRLDYTYVSDSVLDVANEYVLHTPSLSDSVLSAHGLQADDSAVASDHLPVVVDVVRK
jgi:endonuclease/exonuclease/phosphatase family metal-dependent hydrolase